MPALRSQLPRRRPPPAGARLHALPAARTLGADGPFLKRLVLVALGWAWAGAIVWLSLTPSPPKVDFEQSDKVGHFIAYGALMYWFCFLYRSKYSRVSYAVAFIGMGVGLEFIQGMLGYRTYEVFDMYANTLGVLLGWAAALAVLPRIPAR